MRTKGHHIGSLGRQGALERDIIIERRRTEGGRGLSRRFEIQAPLAHLRIVDFVHKGSTEEQLHGHDILIGLATMSARHTLLGVEVRILNSNPGVRGK